MNGKEALWLTCKQKTCCRTTIVPTGRDVWRIVRALELPPPAFLVYFPSAVPRRDAFVLDRSGRSFRLAFAPRPATRTAPPPCLFLLRTRQGHHRCGLGALRPLLCHSFPSQLHDGLLSLQGESCTCRTWSLADVDMAQERVLVAQRQAESEEYCQVVAAWNDTVLSAPPESVHDFAAYCAYLLTAYDLQPSPTDEAPHD